MFSTLQRVVVISVSHYKKANDTRRPPREEPVLHDTAQSDTTSVVSYADSLPNVHWVMAFLCYLSCWSDGRLIMVGMLTLADSSLCFHFYPLAFLEFSLCLH